jgi:predicted nucleic acid-binding protein
VNKSGRVVFDTGSLVSSALRAGSAADRAFSLALRFGVICVCEQSLERLRSVLSKSKLDRYMGKRARLAFVDLLLENAWSSTVSEADLSKIRPTPRDRGISVVLALAAVANADAIVGSDAGLIGCKTRQAIPIVTPAEFAAWF